MAILARVLAAMAPAACADATAAALQPTSCLGSPQKSCAPFAEAMQCPSVEHVCVACTTGQYTLAAGRCTCTSGSWACDSPASPVGCGAGVVRYTDPGCTTRAAADATADAAGAFCDGPFTTGACATPGSPSGSCPASLADVPSMAWCSVTGQTVEQWAGACDGLVAVDVTAPVGDAGNGSTIYFFDVASRGLVGVASGWNGVTSCRAGSSAFRVPDDCLDGARAVGLDDLCADLAQHDGGSTADAAASAPPADSCAAACAAGEPCVQSLATGETFCAGPPCGDSLLPDASADAGACASGQSCEAVQYDPCPAARADAPPCGAATVTYQACVASPIEAGTRAATTTIRKRIGVRP